MTEEQIPDSAQIHLIPEFMQQVGTVYGIEVPTNLPENHPLSEIWKTRIDVTEGASPNPRYSAKGDITDEFPFNFAQSATLKPVMNLKIDLYKPAPESPSMRGVKATVFHVPNSREVIVRYTKDVPPEAHVALSPNPTDSP
jgi:hypothetical protein